MPSEISATRNDIFNVHSLFICEFLLFIYLFIYSRIFIYKFQDDHFNRKKTTVIIVGPAILKILINIIYVKKLV